MEVQQFQKVTSRKGTQQKALGLSKRHENEFQRLQVPFLPYNQCLFIFICMGKRHEKNISDSHSDPHDTVPEPDSTRSNTTPRSILTNPVITIHYNLLDSVVRVLHRFPLRMHVVRQLLPCRISFAATFCNEGGVVGVLARCEILFCLPPI